jgi:hypothetical protein
VRSDFWGCQAESRGQGQAAEDCRLAGGTGALHVFPVISGHHHGTDCRDVICTNTTVESAFEISGLSLRMEQGAQRPPCLDWTSGVLSLERAERRPLCFSDPSWRRSDTCTFLRDIVNSSQHNLTTMDTASSGQDGQAHHVFSDSMARCRTYL